MNAGDRHHLGGMPAHTDGDAMQAKAGDQQPDGFLAETFPT